MPPDFPWFYCHLHKYNGTQESVKPNVCPPLWEDERCYWDLSARVIIVRELLLWHPHHELDDERRLAGTQMHHEPKTGSKGKFSP